MNPEEEELLSAMGGRDPQDVAADVAADEEIARLRRRYSELAPAPQAVPQEPAQQQVSVRQSAEEQPREMPFDFRRALLSFAGGDVGAYDRRRSEFEDRPYVQQQRDLESRAKLAQIQDADLQRQTARSMIDPASPHSRQAQAMFSDYMSGLAEAPGMPAKLSDQLRAAAMSAPRMNASQIASARDYYDRLFGNTLKAVGEQNKANISGESMDLKRLSTDAQLRNAEAMRALAGARFQETREENKRRQDDREAQRSEREAEAYGKDISPLNENEALLLESKALKNKVNTGQIASRLQKARQFVGLKDQNWDELEGKLSAVTNQIIKLQAGSNVTASEAARMKQQLPDLTKDDPEFDAKLETVLRQIELKKQQVNAKHPKSSGVNQPGNLKQKSKADKARRALEAGSGATEKQRKNAEAYLRSIGQLQ